MASIIDAINKNEYKKKFKQYVFTSARHSKEKISQKLNLKQYLLKNKIQFEIINKIDKKIKSKIRKNSIGVFSVPHGYLNQSLLKYLIENYIMFMDQTYQKIEGAEVLVGKF